MITRVRMAVFTMAYFMVSWASMLWAIESRSDESSRAAYTLYYVSPPGIIVLLLNSVAFIRFVGLQRKISLKYPSCRNFWLQLRGLGALYFVHLPLVVLFTMHIHMFRLFIIEIVHLIVIILVLICFTFWMHPVANHYFPYHNFVVRAREIKREIEMGKLGSAIDNSDPGGGLDDSRNDAAFKSISHISSDGNEVESGDNSYPHCRDDNLLSFSGGRSHRRIDDDGRVRVHNTHDASFLSKIRKIQLSVQKRLSKLTAADEQLSKLLSYISPIDVQEIRDLEDRRGNRNEPTYGDNEGNKDAIQTIKAGNAVIRIARSPKRKDIDGRKFSASQEPESRRAHENGPLGVDDGDGYGDGSRGDNERERNRDNGRNRSAYNNEKDTETRDWSGDGETNDEVSNVGSGDEMGIGHRSEDGSGPSLMSDNSPLRPVHLKPLRQKPQRKDI
jgi:hypothetical protein